MVFSPDELLEKLVAIIPPPRSHNTKYSGVFGSHHELRREIILRPGVKRGHYQNGDEGACKDEETSRPKSSWSRLLARSFPFDLTICPHCGEELEVLSAVFDPDSITRYLASMGIDQVHDPPEELALSADKQVSYETMFD